MGFGDGNPVLAREFEEILNDMRLLEARIKITLECKKKFAENDFGG